MSNIIAVNKTKTTPWIPKEIGTLYHERLLSQTCVLIIVDVPAAEDGENKEILRHGAVTQTADICAGGLKRFIIKEIIENRK